MPTLNLGRVGFVTKGTWLISTTYKINDTVTYLGGTYAALQANTGQTPILGGTVYWQEWVANDVVHKSGAETIADVKTFTSSPTVPDATTAFQPLTFGQFSAKLASDINSATAKTTPVDGDLFGIVDSAALNVLKKLSWLNVKATLKTYFDTLYRPIGVLLFSDMPAGTVIQEAYFQTGTLATGTTTIPQDNTIPQITEGDLYMTLAFTPKKANSILRIDIAGVWSSSVIAYQIAALFRDATAGAIATTDEYNASSNTPRQLSMTVHVPAVATSLTTFYVRSGASTAGTTTFNGLGGLAAFGGTLLSSITITEIAQ